MRDKAWEYVGRTVDEAIETALEELGLERDDVHVEILEESQKGFLGLGGKEARIKVELIGEWETQGRKTSEPEEPEPAGKEEFDFHLGEEPTLVEHTGKPRRMVEEMLGIFGIEAMVEAKESDDSVDIDVWGEDVAILIGRGGNTLDAMQYLVNVSCRRKGEVDKRIIIDIEGYRKRKKARLEKDAEQLAKKAIDEGRSIEMEPMSASERKTVHMTLRIIGGVQTESTGDEPDRRVVIHPEKQDVSRETY